MKRILLFSALAAIIFTSCNGIFGKPVHGNGHVITQDRSVGSFRNVSVSGNIDIYVTQDSVSGVKVVADENLMQYIMVNVSGDQLEVYPAEGYELHGSNGGIKVYVSGSKFGTFSASGACDYHSNNQIVSTDGIRIELSGSCDAEMDVNAPSVKAELSGSGSIKLKGTTKEFSVSGSGSTDVKCFDLLAENTSIEISGSGDAEAYASVKLDVSISGSGSVKYKGGAKVSQHVSGSGEISKVD